MTRTDTVVVGTLVALLALIAGLIGGPAIQLAAAPATPSPSVAAGPSFEVRPYVEGVLGKPSSVSPLTARTQADRDLVALLFPGLVRNGPGGTLVPDLAERWSVDKAGKTWTVDIRPDARWHDGTPVTADDVKRVANKYLTKGRVVLSVVPLGKLDQAAKPAESQKVTDNAPAGGPEVAR